MNEHGSYFLHSDQLSVAEYFAGIGLVRMGLEPSGWKVVFANDIEPRKYEMYRAFFPDAETHYRVSDVFDVAPADVPRVTLATCSFPCIDLSLAGNRNGLHGKHSSAFWGFVDHLHAKGDQAPPLVLVENVPGWLTSNQGADFRVAVQALNQAGYACDVFVLDARRFVPQSRERVFIVGAKHRPPLVHTDALLNRSPALLTSGLRRAIAANLDLLWTFLNLPTPPPLLKSGLSDLVEDLSPNRPEWWSVEEVKRHLQMMTNSHRGRVEALRQGKGFSYRTFYRRVRQGNQRAEVRPDDIAGCLRTAVGGSSRQFLIKAGKGQVQMRPLTAREYARLQGVPDSYPIDVDAIQAINGFGDAVCVPVIDWIARHALKPLIDELASPLGKDIEALRAAYPSSILRDLSVSD